MKHLLSALTGIVLLCAPLTLRAQVISEVLWMGSDQSTADEWLELARLPCASAACPPVDLGGWKITSLNSSGIETVIATLPAGTLVSLEHPLVVARQAAATSRLAQEPDILSSSVSLPNTKLLLKLINAAGAVADEVDDGVGAPFAGANPSGGTKASMERVDLSAAGTVKENWRTATESRGLDAGAAMLGTPGWFAYPDLPGDPPPHDPPAPEDSGSGSTLPPEDDPSSGSGSTVPEPPPETPPPAPLASPPPAHVILNAVLPNPAGKDELGEWIELKNLSDAPAVLTGWKLVGEGSAAKSFALDGRSIDASSVLRLTFAETQLSLTNTKFTLSLRDASGVEVSSVSWENAAEDRAYRPNLYGELTMHGTVSRVIDGDTFEVVFDEEPTPDGRTSATVRLIGVDAPESVHPTKKPEPYGPESSLFLKGLLEKKKVELQFDTENWDFYDRMLAYASVDGQISAQERLLSTGMARVYPDYPFARRGLFDQYELQAKVLKVGIWSVPASSSEYKAPAVIVAAASKTESATVSPAAASGASAVAFLPAWSKLRISEVYAHVSAGDAGMLGKEWIELRNDGDAALKLAGWKIRVGDGSKAKSSAITFAGTVLPGGFAVLLGSGETFKLRDSGNAVVLVAPDGTVVSATAYPSLKAGESWATEVGGCVTAAPTPGLPNRCTAKAAVAAKTAKTKTAATRKTPAAKKKTSAKKAPAPEFVLAQQSLGELQSRPPESLTFGESGGGAGSFWQAFTFFLAAVSLSQGALMALVAWKSGLLTGERKLSVGGA